MFYPEFNSYFYLTFICAMGFYLVKTNTKLICYRLMLLAVGYC